MSLIVEDRIKMPKIKEDHVLTDDPNSVLRASKYISNIALKNLDNREEEPTLKVPDTKGMDKAQSVVAEFDEKISKLSEMFDIIKYSSTYLYEKYQNAIDLYGAGRKKGVKKGGSRPTKLETAETPKSRYYKYYRDAPYNVRGAGRMKGGADEDADFDLGLDEEDDEEEDEDVDINDGSSIAPSTNTGSAGDDLPALGDTDLIGGDFTVSKLVDTMVKSSKQIKLLVSFFNKKVVPVLPDLPRSEYQSFIREKLSLIDEITDTFGFINPYIDDIHRYLSAEVGGNTGNILYDAFYTLEDEMVKLVEAIKNSKKTFVEKRRTGAGMSGGVRSGGALGGTPILSSIQQYQHIPTKYLL
jgi:hypothetical protein